MYWKFDANKFALHQLPPLLRRPAIYALLKCLMIALNTVHETFVRHRDKTVRQLNYNAFTISLERFLNELYSLDNSIYITEYKSSNVYLSLSSENNPKVYVGNQNEGDILYLSSASPETVSGGFVVKIPAGMATEENIAIIRKWVDYYRMAGTIYTIESYE